MQESPIRMRWVCLWIRWRYRQRPLPSERSSSSSATTCIRLAFRPRAPLSGQTRVADSRQVRAIPPGVRGIFVPGNHDWANETAFGLYSIRLQEKMIASLAQGRNVRFSRATAVPVRTPVDVGRLRFIALDTQWWLHSYIVRDSSSHCPTNTMGTVTAALREQVRPPGGVA